MASVAAAPQDALNRWFRACALHTASARMAAPPLCLGARRKVCGRTSLEQAQRAMDAVKPAEAASSSCSGSQAVCVVHTPNSWIRRCREVIVWHGCGMCARLFFALVLPCLRGELQSTRRTGSHDQRLPGCTPRWRSLPFLRIYIAVTHPRSRNACQAAHCARALRILCGRLRMGHDRQGAAAAAAAARGTGRGG